MALKAALENQVVKVLVVKPHQPEQEAKVAMEQKTAYWEHVIIEVRAAEPLVGALALILEMATEEMVVQVLSSSAIL